MGFLNHGKPSIVKKIVHRLKLFVKKEPGPEQRGDHEAKETGRAYKISGSEGGSGPPLL